VVAAVGDVRAAAPLLVAHGRPLEVPEVRVDVRAPGEVAAHWRGWGLGSADGGHVGRKRYRLLPRAAVSLVSSDGVQWHEDVPMSTE